MRILFLITIIFMSGLPATGHALSFPSDVLPQIQKIIQFKAAEKSACNKLFPDLAGRIDAAWKDWPLSNLNIRLMVNGKEWIDQELQNAFEETLADMKRIAPEKARTQCARFPASLSDSLQQFDYDVFVKPLLEFGNKN